MKLLVLDGTLFLGRHVVETALERGHEVTLFNRGRTNPSLFPEAEHLIGDRDGALSTLAGRSWDAVVDPSGYVPRTVRSSAELLAETGHYTFVSSISVYRDFTELGSTRTSPSRSFPKRVKTSTASMVRSRRSRKMSCDRSSPSGR
jgi:2'-hydroxyisoflavone reductase